MRKVLIGLGVVIILLGAAVVALPFFIPVDWVREQAEARATDATGRQLSIGGDINLSIFPNVQIEANNVSLANEPGSAGPDMVSLSKLALNVELIPLLSGALVVNEFVLVEPVIHLETHADGTANWQFDQPAGTSGDSGQTGTDQTGGQGLADLKLGDIRIENGKVTLHDVASGETTGISAINMALNLPDLSSPLSSAGSVDYKGKTLKLKVGVASLGALMEGGSSTAQVSFESGLMTGGFDGTMARTGDVSGKVDVAIPSLSSLMTWLEQPFDPNAPVPETINVSGMLDMAGNNVSFTGADIAVDALKAHGDMAIDMGGDRPMITANLQSEMLDLNPYLPRSEGGSSGSGSDGASSGGDGGATLSQPWSDEPIDFSGLDAANADLTFDLAGLRVQEIEVGRSRLHIVVNNGSAVIDLLEATLYGGNGTAHVEIDRSGSRPSVVKNLSVRGVQAEPLLAAATGFDQLSGAANLSLDINTTGTSRREFVNNLFGNGAFSFTDGAFKGANIAAMVRDLDLSALGSAISSDQMTDFTALTGTCRIENGLLTNDDLNIAAPLIRMTGSGNVNMPERTLDYTIIPRGVATLEGQGGGAADSAGIPINVRGPWANPQIAPDMEAIARQVLENPKTITDTIDSLTGGDIDAGGLLDGLGGNAADALKSLFD